MLNHNFKDLSLLAQSDIRNVICKHVKEGRAEVLKVMSFNASWLQRGPPPSFSRINGVIII